MFAVTFAPAVSWLERRRVPRWLGASLVTLAAALALGALLMAVAVPLVSQSRELLGNLPHLAHDLFKPGGPLAFVDRRFHIERRIGRRPAAGKITGAEPPVSPLGKAYAWVTAGPAAFLIPLLRSVEPQHAAHRRSDRDRN
jgi:AI-2E family transporter